MKKMIMILAIASLLFMIGCGKDDPVGNNDDINIESHSGTTNSQGEYSFHSDISNQDYTVKIKNESYNSLSYIDVNVEQTDENMIIIAKDADEGYYPNIKIISSRQLNKISMIDDDLREDRPIFTILLAAYTIGQTIHWLTTDPPNIEVISDDEGFDQVCITGDLEDLINSFALLSGGLGHFLHIGSSVASALDLSSTFACLLDATVGEITSELINANFDTDADYTYCFFEDDNDDELPIMYVTDVETGTNNPPNSPFSPNPSDNATNISVSSNLSWNCSDPDGDPLTYDVYFGTDSTPDYGELVSTNQSGTSYNLNTLNNATTYYWKIVAKDNNGNETTGDTWQFTTTNGGGTGTVTDIDGNVYQTIMIGNQEWMAENLKVTHYRNGDAIPTGLSNSSWSSTTSGAYAVYNDNESYADTYGYLYNWYAVDDERGIAPEGWHIASDEEWMELEMALGMSESEANSTGFRGTDQGSQLAGNSSLWTSGNLENNGAFGTSGFTALPGGSRHSDGDYYSVSYGSFFWSSTVYSDTNAWYRDLGCKYSDVFRSDNAKSYGFSLRCVRD